jgi:F1F0 ATPase subunit 2
MGQFEPVASFSGFILGLALGLVFFGGLWWTVQRGLASPWPAAWFLPSLLGRMAVVGFGFYYISSQGLYAIGACLAGFLLARIGVTWATRLPNEAQEGQHPT